MSVTQQVAVWLSESSSTVAFTGAGISTESGIPDFRSPGGIWATSQPVYFDEFMASRDARYEYWRQKAIAHRDFAASAPNAGHRVLAQWQATGLLARVVTQNIDGLHKEAGSQDVLELHGTAREVSCLQCHARFPADTMVAQFLADDTVPFCPKCGSPLLKHATISFGQSLDPAVLRQATQACQHADLLLAMGSSLVVEPAASLPRLAREQGARLVIINRDPTPQDDQANAVIHGSIGETLTAIDRHLGTIDGHLGTIDGHPGH